MFDLSHRTTLALRVQANEVVEIHSEAEASALCADRKRPWLVLSGGSNILLPAELTQPVLIPLIKGIVACEQNAESILIEVGAGESWNDLVWYCLEQGWYGLENLVEIPGWAGAAPIQNIGAYGVEVKDVLDSVRLVDLDNGTVMNRSAMDCQLAYRSSIFKHKEQDRWLISALRLRLWRQPHLNLSYAGIRAELEARGCRQPSPVDVAQAVRSMRQRKLVDPAVLPNAGSFFQNPVVSNEQLEEILRHEPDLMYFPDASGHAKLAAGWLIERCGLKGQSREGVGCSNQHALVVVNNRPGQNTLHEVLDWAGYVQSCVLDRFGVHLDIEPRIYH